MKTYSVKYTITEFAGSQSQYLHMFIQPHFYNYFSPEGGGYFASERVQKIHHLPIFLYHETRLWDLKICHVALQSHGPLVK